MSTTPASPAVPTGVPDTGDGPVGRDDLVLVQPALPISLRAMRRSVAQWLAAAAWPVPEAEDVELAVHEALANVVDHAYLADRPGPMHLHAWITAVRPADTVSREPVPTAGAPLIAAPGFPAARIPALRPTASSLLGATAPAPGRVATLVVSDRGRWTLDRRTVDPGGHRGHGLTVMTGMMAAVHLQRADGGTSVVLVSRPVPPSPRPPS